MVPGSYVVRRGRTYSFRCRLPADLTVRLGRLEFVRALGTEKPAVAHLLAAGLGIRLEKLWTMLRMGGAEQEVEAALDAWFKQELERVWRQYASGDHARSLVPLEATAEEGLAIRRATLQGDADATLERRSADFHRGDYSAARAGTRSIVASLSAPFDEGDQRFTILAKRVMDALCEVENARSQWAEGDEAYVPSLAASATQQTAVVPDDANAPTLAEVADHYLAHRKTEKCTSEKMIGQLRGQIQVVLNELGSETKVTAVTPQIAGRVYSSFRSLPGNFGKIEALRGMTLFKAAEDARKLGLAPMSSKTVNNHMTTLRGLFKEAIDQGAMKINPFAEKHVRVTGSMGSERGFTPEELESLLTSPVFIGCERKGRPFQTGLYLLNDWRFWLPITAMLTGARIAELCQLSREDISERHGVWTLQITAAGGRRLKTPQSERIVPLHEELIRLGFLSYVRKRPWKEGVGSLFAIPRPTNDDWGAKAGNWL